MEDAQHIIIPIALFAMIFGIVYIAISAYHRQNIAMIEAGMNPKKPKVNAHNKLRNALLIICIPIGILVGNSTYYRFGMAPEPAAIVFAFLFGGIALTATYFIEESKSNHKGLSEEE